MPTSTAPLPTTRQSTRGFYCGCQEPQTSGRRFKCVQHPDLYVSLAFTEGDSISSQRGGRRRGVRRARSKLQQRTTEEEQGGEASCKQRLLQERFASTLLQWQFGWSCRDFYMKRKGIKKNNTRGFSWRRTKCCIRLHKLS